eukprot:gene20316-biopygen2560
MSKSGFSGFGGEGSNFKKIPAPSAPFPIPCPSFARFSSFWRLWRHVASALCKKANGSKTGGVPDPRDEDSVPLCRASAVPVSSHFLLQRRLRRRRMLHVSSWRRLRYRILYSFLCAAPVAPHFLISWEFG